MIDEIEKRLVEIVAFVESNRESEHMHTYLSFEDFDLLIAELRKAREAPIRLMHEGYILVRERDELKAEVERLKESLPCEECGYVEDVCSSHYEDCSQMPKEARDE